MSRKQYSPARVKNPTSIQHIVRVKPGQSILVFLDSTLYKNHRVELSTNNLRIVSDKFADPFHRIEIAQLPHVYDWAAYSSCLIGEIWVDSGLITSRIVVMLESTTPSKTNVITTVNPDCSDIRIRPQDIIEIILFDLEFRERDQWFWEWHGFCDLDVEQIGYSYLNLSIWRRFYEHIGDESPENPYARCVRTQACDNPWCRQHHFWFRFDKTILALLEKEDGIKHVGDFKLSGQEDRLSRKGHLSVYLDIDKKYQPQAMLTLAKPKLEELPQTPSNFGLASGIRLKHKTGPIMWDVDMELIASPALEEGCTIISAEPDAHTFDDDGADYYPEYMCQGPFGTRSYRIYDDPSDWLE